MELLFAALLMSIPLFFAWRGCWRDLIPEALFKRIRL